MVAICERDFEVQPRSTTGCGRTMGKCPSTDENGHTRELCCIYNAECKSRRERMDVCIGLQGDLLHAFVWLSTANLTAFLASRSHKAYTQLHQP